MPAAEPSAAPRKRPVYLDLTSIRQPVPAIVSILHRISGALLFLVGIPLLLCVVGASLASAESYASLRAAFANPFARLVLLGLCWAYLHHLLAGLRHLVLDAHFGLDLAPARRSAALVLVVSIILTLAIAARLW